ncbi:RagB/SusD family nutrient uptake outer membrane protein [Pedobacter rhizosphaerae]|uniref:Starch-binding associating with outer membrane n=1 Tax=Pedobacter rhizosphaerae TaxID=390241 RepID=A0A1H9R370_9SPHI|nr:RagB/SusD family nutrient uptake outer membrane protein [Pedobacter rhizosphaerae]SER66499.1 Starch-binding associating with outer membrane [Pedobacter rhizosphaerae]
MKKISIFLALVVFAFITSCKRDFLDIVPDNIATIDNAFTNRNEAEKYLFTCYSYLPQESNIYQNPAMLVSDEFWTYWPITSLSRLPSGPQQIARGNQSLTFPLLNYWDGESDGKAIFRALRDCNIFLEHVNEVPDLDASQKTIWAGEVQFLKAYYHFYLLRMYGPIPIIDKNLPITATTEEVRVKREPLDKVVDYIASLMDTAATKLPISIQNRSSELGHITRPIALSIKARVLTLAASPQFNGNSDYSGLKNADGTALVNTTFSVQKWQRAAEACKQAIDLCERAGIRLYKFNAAVSNISDRLKLEMSIRNSVCEPWNQELIWGFTNGTGSGIQLQAMPRLDVARSGNESTLGQLAPTLRIAELFYTKNGVPISEDKTWDFSNRYSLKTATGADQDYLQNGYITAALHFDREPRFYADLGFDGSQWYMQNKTWPVQAKAGQGQSRRAAFGYSITGYYSKKLVNWKFVIQDGLSYTQEQYPWPIMRLSDLYLLYAEALNEASGPSEAVYQYLNLVRERAGLQSVQSSWDTYSINPGKYRDQAGLRQIIHQERGIEMAFEGSRFWDLKRWKEASSTLNNGVYGWDIEQTDATGYYRPKLLFNQKFVAPRDYLWPIKENNTIVNPNLVQNPGW